jgi:hypothetical protein
LLTLPVLSLEELPQHICRQARETESGRQTNLQTHNEMINPMKAYTKKVKNIKLNNVTYLNVKVMEGMTLGHGTSVCSNHITYSL